MDNQLEYRTKGMEFAAALLTEGVTYLRTEKDPDDKFGKRKIFIFNYSEDIERIRMEWDNGTLLSLLPRYADNIRKVKAIIHSE